MKKPNEQNTPHKKYREPAEADSLTSFNILNAQLIVIQPLQEVRGAATAYNNLILSGWVELYF